MSIARELIKGIKNLCTKDIPRNYNQLVDSRCKLAFDGTRLHSLHFVEISPHSVNENIKEIFNIEKMNQLDDRVLRLPNIRESN